MFCAAWKTVLFFFALKRIAPHPLLKVSPAFSKAAGSQGSALSRVPQDTEPPFDFRLAKINQNKNKSAVRRRRNTFAHKVRSWKTNLPDWFSPLLPFVHSLRSGCRSRAEKKERPSERMVFPMSGQWPRSISLAEASDFLIVKLKPGSDTGFQRGISPSADGDQVPPGRASLRGWIAPGLRPGPILTCGRDSVPYSN